MTTLATSSVLWVISLQIMLNIVCDHKVNPHHKVYAYIVKHNYILGDMLFTICIAQLHVSATNVGILQVVQ